MVLYPFIYNFIGCLKKYTERERKESLKKIYCMEWQWYWNTGWHFMVHSRGFGPVSGGGNGRVCTWSRLRLRRLSWDACSFPRKFCSRGMQGTMYLDSVPQVYLWWPSAAFHCKYFLSCSSPHSQSLPCTNIFANANPKFIQSEFPILTFCLVLHSMACSNSPQEYIFLFLRLFISLSLSPSHYPQVSNPTSFLSASYPNLHPHSSNFYAISYVSGSIPTPTWSSWSL